MQIRQKVVVGEGGRIELTLPEQVQVEIGEVFDPIVPPPTPE